MKESSKRIISGFVFGGVFIASLYTHLSFTILTFIFGIISTVAGVSAALSIATDVSKISPHILWSGLKSALVTTFSGGFVLLFSTFSWYFFSIKHKPHA